ncbi:sugar ABC transporter ATP-binding protein [Nonomuraea deserti]|uniref:Sugar ABC transporter ATP-binding protein n=1 Tax=Nonomuraea deserti TaxID=1848322 RepID=A0A4R4VJD6_9ACTN|nr:sugar ABC transporter ATP-binding protein [Nonomuraea deserti]TDD05838.1 sugar ABC transporter ATP-binding protein [Nonomuraea deserti]
MSPLLSIEGLTKRYGRTVALDEVDLEIRPNEVVGLIGQNGAGKSTLLKLLAGVQQPDSGRLVMRGSPIKVRNPAHAAEQGIGMVFQEQSLVPNLTVAENIFLGRPNPGTAGGVYKWRRLNALAREQLEKTGSEISPSALVQRLSFADRQMVELTKVLALEERTDGDLLILFDEPTSVLSAAEIETLFAQIRRLKRRASIVFVSHRMDEVLAISDRIYVMRDGRRVAERDAAACDENELYSLMVGENRAEDYFLDADRKPYDRSATALEVEGLTAEGSFSDVTFSVCPGQIVGVAGVIGSGREALCRALFGALPTAAGRVRLRGEEVTMASPRDGVRLGVGYLPAERKHEGMVAERSISENLVLASTPALTRAGLLSWARESDLVEGWIERLGVKAPSARVKISQLSGGNQQKVVLAKWLALPHLRVLVLDHPTRGLDLKAKTDVYKHVRAAAARGVAIVLLSDTLEELLGLSDEIVVMRDGRVTGHFPDVPDTPPSSEELVKLMV